MVVERVYGLDGLAIVPVMIASLCFAAIAYVVGNAVLSDYLQINFVPGTGELAVLCGAVVERVDGLDGRAIEQQEIRAAGLDRNVG